MPATKRMVQGVTGKFTEAAARWFQALVEDQIAVQRSDKPTKSTLSVMNLDGNGRRQVAEGTMPFWVARLPSERLRRAGLPQFGVRSMTAAEEVFHVLSKVWSPEP